MCRNLLGTKLPSPRPDRAKESDTSRSKRDDMEVD
ncbi:hypothetical protein OROGR_003248 [Orobanche gracilis]